MNTNGTPTATPGMVSTDTLVAPDTIDLLDADSAPEQLSLLSTPSVPLQFRLDERTRRAGLQHVAELRALMTAQAAERRSGSGRAAVRLGRRSAGGDQIAA